MFKIDGKPDTKLDYILSALYYTAGKEKTEAILEKLDKIEKEIINIKSEIAEIKKWIILTYYFSLTLNFLKVF